MHSIVGLSRLGARRPAVMSLNTGSIEVSSTRATVEQILTVPARGAGRFIAVQRSAARTLRRSSWPWVDRGYQCVSRGDSLYGFSMTQLLIKTPDKMRCALAPSVTTVTVFPVSVADGCCANPQRVFIPQRSGIRGLLRRHSRTQKQLALAPAACPP